MKIYSKVTISLLLCSSFSLADEYAVIANTKIKDLSSTQIKAIFLKKISVIGDIKIVPLNLEARNPLRESFENDVLNMSFERLKSYWTKQHYLGKRPPISMRSQESVKTFVKKVDGAIGYIDAKLIDDSVKVLYRWSE